MDRYTELLFKQLSGKIAKEKAIEIAKYHRVQGSPGFHNAAEYIKSELEEFGIDAAQIEEFPADGKTTFWSYNAPISWWAEHAELRLVEPEEEVLCRYQEQPLCLATHSKSTDTTAEVVDLGEGIKEEDYSGKDLEGKIPLVTGSARRTHIKAINHGAIGTIHHPPREKAKHPNLVGYMGIWPDQSEREKSTFGFSISDKQYQKINEYLEKDEPVKVACQSDGKLYDGSMEVVTATVKGTEKPEEEILLIAHLCHPKPSVNDNASGSSVLLEIARSMMELLEAGELSHPKRTIRFLWVPELYGTVAWMDAHQETLENIHSVINLDMVGEHPVTVGKPLHLISTPDSTPSYLTPLLIELLENVADDPRGIALDGWEHPLNYRVKPFSGGSDHLLFCDQAFGIPSVMFYNPDQFHHTSYDDISRVDSTKLQRVGVIAGSAVLTIANADEQIITELATITTNYGSRRIAKTGTKLTRKILNAEPSKEDFSTNIDTTYIRGRKMLEETKKRELQALTSIEKLSTIPPKLKHTMKTQLKEQAAKEKAKLKTVYEQKIQKTNSSALRKEVDKKIIETKTIIPKRTYTGPTSRIDRDKIEKKEDREWIQEFEYGLELLNFADGSRSIYEIAIAVNLEYETIDPLEVKRFFDIYKSLNKITYKERREERKRRNSEF